MDYDIVAGWVGLIISVVVAIGTIVRAFSERKKGLGDAFTAMQTALAQLQENYNNLRKDFDELNEKYYALEIYNRALTEQLVEHKIPPISMKEALKRHEEKRGALK